MFVVAPKQNLSEPIVLSDASPGSWRLIQLKKMEVASVRYFPTNEVRPPASTREPVFGFTSHSHAFGELVENADPARMIQSNANLIRFRRHSSPYFASRRQDRQFGTRRPC